jgi:hypothetical protein
LAEYRTGACVTFTEVEPDVYPLAEPVIVAVPAVVEVNLTEHEPPVVVQYVGDSDPKLVVNVTTVLDLSDVEAVIVDD